MDKSEKYWKINIKYVKILLTIWFIFSFLFGIILKDFLNEFLRYRIDINDES